MIDMQDTNSSAAPLQTPVGVWSGVVRHDNEADAYTISFAPDGTIALRTPVTVGTGTWVAGQEGRFSYELTETFLPVSGRAGRLEVSVEARIEGDTHSGVGTAWIYTPDDVLVHTTKGEFGGPRVATEPADWHAVVTGGTAKTA